MMLAVMPSTLGDTSICATIWRPKSCSLPTRETTMAAATEISRPGTWATRASPTASKI